MRHKAKLLLCLATISLVPWAGCRGPNETLPAGAVARLDETRHLAAPVTVENLTVWPVVAEKYLELGEFLTLQEAEKRGLAVVRERGGNQSRQNAAQVNLGPTNADAAETRQNEVDTPEQQTVEQTVAEVSGGATVNTVVIENKSDLPILICAGTVIKGGNQDRQIAQDFLVQGKTTVPVEAFCIERGRWTDTREGALTNGVFKVVNSLTTNTVRSSAQYSQSQSDVWFNVADGNAMASKDPETSTLLATIEETDTKRKAVRERLANAVRAHFEALRAQGRPAVGLAYAIDGKPVSVRTFAHPRLLDDHLDTFVTTVAMEADLAQRAAGGKAATKVAAAEDVLEMVRKINEAEEQIFATAAANDNGLRQNEIGGNLNCYAEILVPSKNDASGEAPVKTRVTVSQDWTASVEK